jgi:hypothetical protein
LRCHKTTGPSASLVDAHSVAQPGVNVARFCRGAARATKRGNKGDAGGFVGMRRQMACCQRSVAAAAAARNVLAAPGVSLPLQQVPRRGKCARRPPAAMEQRSAFTGETVTATPRRPCVDAGAAVAASVDFVVASARCGARGGVQHLWPHCGGTPRGLRTGTAVVCRRATPSVNACTYLANNTC